MYRSRFHLRLGVVYSLAASLLAACLANSPSSVMADGTEFFERSVRPLLIEKCGDCHGAEDAENDLTLTTVKGIAAGGSSGATLVPSQPAQSRLLQAVRYTSKLKMPPDARLSSSEIAILEKWVREGAALPGEAAIKSTRRRRKATLSDKDRAWWSFQPIRDPVPPSPSRADRVRTGVDRFVLHQLELKGLSFSPDAERETLIRRATFDLIGIPPSPDEVDSFLSDPRADAFERLLDRLLASPQYGIRWGRHWLDVARYADTNGGGFDYVYPNAWRYRDYVVRAFNRDKPYDQFLLEQLAGDRLPIDCDQQTYLERLTATGLLTLAPKGLGMQDKERMILDVVDDQIDVLGRSLLGLTLSCARCHDHKFDPISTEDYYALAGIFRSTASLVDTDKNPSYWPERPLELPAVTKARESFLARKAANAKATTQARNKADAEVVSRAKRRLPEYLFAAARIRESLGRQTAVAHWPFDETNGAVARATVGPDGRLSNASQADGKKPTRTSGRIGGALRFSGQREVVSIDAQQQSAFDFGVATDFTVSLWVRAAKDYSPQTADTIMAANYGKAMWFIALRPGAYNGVYLRHYDGKRLIDVKPSRNRLPDLTNNQWRHLVFTSDRDGSGRLYIDGELAGETPIASVSKSAQFSQLASLQIGAAANQFQGDLDDVAVWNRQLSPAEILALYSQAADAAIHRNAIQVERAGKPKQKAKNPTRSTFTYQQAARDGLAPSIVRRFVDLLAKSSTDPKSPLHSFTESQPATLDEVEAFLSDSGDRLRKLFHDKKAGPFVLGRDGEQFYEAPARRRLVELAKEAEEIGKLRVSDPVMAMVAFDASQPMDVRVHLAGDHKNQGDQVRRGFPKVLGGEEGLAIADGGSGRLELARWLTAAENPLTARVLVNRVWQWHFGDGLVRTSDDFGRRGETPSHPELLDWLATRFVDNGWSLKELHRQIMLSTTYRQSSGGIAVEANFAAAQTVDSGNRLYWRMNRRRLEGEALRDAMLAVSGRLDHRMGGTVNDWKPKMFSVDNANAETANYQTERRSIYLPVVRGAAMHEMLQVFDFGDSNSLTARRDVTTVATQALYLMNNPFTTTQAEHFSDRLASLEPNDAARRIRLAYRFSLSREPTESERKRALAFVGEAKSPDWRLFCQALLCLNEFAYVE